MEIKQWQEKDTVNTSCECVLSKPDRSMLPLLEPSSIQFNLTPLDLAFCAFRLTGGGGLASPDLKKLCDLCYHHLVDMRFD